MPPTSFAELLLEKLWKQISSRVLQFKAQVHWQSCLNRTEIAEDAEIRTETASVELAVGSGLE